MIISKNSTYRTMFVIRNWLYKVILLMNYKSGRRTVWDLAFGQDNNGQQQQVIMAMRVRDHLTLEIPRERNHVLSFVRAIFVWPWKMVSVKCSLFLLSANGWIRSNTGTLRSPAKENPSMEKPLFDWPIVLQYDVKSNSDWFLQRSSGMTFFQPSVRLTNQKPRAFASVRQTNQIAIFPFVCCFCFVRAFSFQGHTKNTVITNIITNQMINVDVGKVSIYVM